MNSINIHAWVWNWKTLLLESGCHSLALAANSWYPSRTVWCFWNFHLEHGGHFHLFLDNLDFYNSHFLPGFLGKNRFTVHMGFVKASKWILLEWFGKTLETTFRPSGWRNTTWRTQSGDLVIMIEFLTTIHHLPATLSAPLPHPPNHPYAMHIIEAVAQITSGHLMGQWWCLIQWSTVMLYGWHLVPAGGDWCWWWLSTVVNSWSMMFSPGQYAAAWATWQQPLEGEVFCGSNFSNWGKIFPKFLSATARSTCIYLMCSIVPVMPCRGILFQDGKICITWVKELSRVGSRSWCPQGSSTKGGVYGPPGSSGIETNEGFGWIGAPKNGQGI